MDAAPFVPQSFHERLTPCAVAPEQDNSSMAPAATMLLLVTASETGTAEVSANFAGISGPRSPSPARAGSSLAGFGVEDRMAEADERIYMLASRARRHERFLTGMIRGRRLARPRERMLRRL